MRRLLPTVLSIVLFSCVASVSWAHTFDPERFIIIDSTKKNIEVLITFREAPGKRLDYLLGIYDRNKDGVLSKKESLAIAPALKKIALSGLKISPSLSGEETRIKYKSKDGLSIALLYQLPKVVNTLIFQFENDRKHIPTSVNFRGNSISILNGIGPTKSTIIRKSGSFGIVR